MWQILSKLQKNLVWSIPISMSLGLFVFVPLFVGLMTQYYGIKKYGTHAWDQQIKPKFPPFSALGVTMIAFVAMSLKAKHIIANPGDIITILVPLIIFYVVSYGFLSLTGRLFFKRDDQSRQSRPTDC